jgi:outer membrane protein
MLAGDTLSLPEVLERALEANPDLLIERENLQISRDQILRELGEFGWKVEASIDQHRSWKPLNTREFIAIGGISLPGGDARVFHEHRQTAQAALRRTFEHGTELAFRSNLSRLVNSSNETSSSALFSPELEGFVGISVSQPLWKGYGYGNTYARVELAEIKADAALLLARVKAMNLVAEVASRYVDVLAAEENLAIRKENVRRALELVERNQRRQDAGVGVEIEVTTAELAVSQRRSELIDTAVEKVERLNALLGLIDRDPDLGERLTLLPLDGEFERAETPDVASLMDRARAGRLDVLYYTRVVASAELNLRRARDAANPQLDLTATYGISALSGRLDELTDAFEERQGEQWSVGLLFKMDLERRKGRAELRIAERQLFQARIELHKALRSVGLEIDTAVRRVESARQRLATARQARDLAAKRLDQEMQALEQGKGDLYRVVEQQQIYGDTLAEVVSTQAFLHKATIAFWMATGQIFERFAIAPEAVRETLFTAPSGLTSR